MFSAFIHILYTFIIHSNKRPIKGHQALTEQDDQQQQDPPCFVLVLLAMPAGRRLMLPRSPQTPIMLCEAQINRSYRSRGPRLPRQLCDLFNGVFWMSTTEQH